MRSITASSVFVFLTASATYAEVCDYRPTYVVGLGGAAAIGTTGAATAIAGPAIQAAGFYTLTHATTGLTMLGSTAGGVSAAGTVGIMGGSTVAGSVVAFLTAPATVLLAGAVAIGGSGFEGVCYFQDERITDPEIVLEQMVLLSLRADPTYFRLNLPHGTAEDASITINYDGQSTDYFVANLYIVEGVLMHRDWFKNTTIGNIEFVPIEAAE
jgi:hypothetical protein